MRSKHIIFCYLCFAFCKLYVNAQYDSLNIIPNFFNSPTTKSVQTTLNTSIINNSADARENFRSNATYSEEIKSENQISNVQQGNSKQTRIQHYDPFLENRLKTPDKSEGLFGLPIKEVEQYLVSFGAKKYSYAFGKYSRLKLSVYIITLLFDKNRKLGGVIVSPTHPFTRVESKFREFILKTFLAGADLSKFQTIITNDRLEIWFEDNRNFSSTVIELLERKKK